MLLHSIDRRCLRTPDIGEMIIDIVLNLSDVQTFSLGLRVRVSMLSHWMQRCISYSHAAVLCSLMHRVGVPLHTVSTFRMRVCNNMGIKSQLSLRHVMHAILSDKRRCRECIALRSVSHKLLHNCCTICGLPERSLNPQSNDVAVLGTVCTCAHPPVIRDGLHYRQGGSKSAQFPYVRDAGICGLCRADPDSYQYAPTENDIQQVYSRLVHEATGRFDLAELKIPSSVLYELRDSVLRISDGCSFHWGTRRYDLSQSRALIHRSAAYFAARMDPPVVCSRHRFV